MTPIRPLPTDDHSPWEGDLSPTETDFQSLAATTGAEFKHEAARYVEHAGAAILDHTRKVGPLQIDLMICGDNGRTCGVLAHGGFDDRKQAGLRRTDTVKKLGFDAVQLGRLQPGIGLVAVTSHLPDPGTAAARQLAMLRDDFIDVVATNGDLAGFWRLRHLLHDDPNEAFQLGPWRANATRAQLALFDSTPQAIPGTELPY